LAQIFWTYQHQNGNQYEVNLYHGEDSKHVIIHCNGKIIQMDFKVFDTKSYSFYLETILVQLTIKKEPNDLFTYSLTHVVTNKIIAKENTKNTDPFIYKLYVLLILLLLLITIILVLF